MNECVKSSEYLNGFDIVLQGVGLSKVFQVGEQQHVILNEVDFQLRKGEQVAVMGASGAGKSTLLHLLAGLDQSTEGDVIVLGESLLALNEVAKSRIRNQHLGFIYQHHHLLPELNALENVMVPLQLAPREKRLTYQQIKQRAKQLLARVELTHRLTHRVGELSGGERQRIAIARALVHEPRCVLADEPTGNLDRDTAAVVYQLMLELTRTLEMSFIVVTHDHQLAQKMDRVLYLENGKLL